MRIEFLKVGERGRIYQCPRCHGSGLEVPVVSSEPGYRPSSWTCPPKLHANRPAMSAPEPGCLRREYLLSPVGKGLAIHEDADTTVGLAHPQDFQPTRPGHLAFEGNPISRWMAHVWHTAAAGEGVGDAPSSALRVRSEFRDGGDGWESKPLGTPRQRATDGFEDRERHQPPNIPGG
jgi:hypothetical protein